MGCKCKEILEAERKFGMGVRIHCLEMRAKALEERLSELEQPEKKEIGEGLGKQLEGWAKRWEKGYHILNVPNETLSIFIEWLEEQKKFSNSSSIENWNYTIECLIVRAKQD